ncbi:hypothetical protein D0Z00_000037 [Geotrichum galactomycetum]|uniref:Uncharacterized protein n=1 Tax=Geotrichum galactomycetum TaxID=27317 RepID=A0ACB6VAW8_9ASCO|nr:hypothetical protein D0Z00_000037 [Geotrichum candidum]
MRPTGINSSLVRSSKRFLQTVQQPSVASTVSPMVFGTGSASSLSSSSTSAADGKWTTYSLPKFGALDNNNSSTKKASFSIPFGQPMKAFKAPSSTPLSSASTSTPSTPKSSSPLASTPTTKTAKPAAAPRRKLRPRKAAIQLTPTAVSHLAQLLNQPEPKLIRIGVKNRGCSGLTYNLEYVDKPGKFDEEVLQDGVKVLIDSKALFSIIGSEMDWVDDKLSSRFVFHNPNSKGQCGCGESFMV